MIFSTRSTFIEASETDRNDTHFIHHHRQSIDPDKWDACIRESINETPLAYSWVLDHLSPGWEAIIFGDYKGVMPLPVSSRLGIKILQMPPEVLTLGILSDNSEIIRQFPNILQHPEFSTFRLIAYNGTPFQNAFSDIPGTTIKQTQVLFLNKRYSELHRNFSRSHRRNIRAFHENGGVVEEDSAPTLFTDLLAEIGTKRTEIFMPPRYRKQFNMMARDATSRNQGTTLSVWRQGKPVAAAFFLFGQKRVIPYHIANTEGQHLKASFALIDHFIQKHAESGLKLDFAGSVLPHVAEFNRRFGAVPVPYPSVTINHLPLIVRKIKELKLLFRLKHLFGSL